MDPRVLREMILASPEELSLLRQNNPPLADSINDPGTYNDIYWCLETIVQLLVDLHSWTELTYWALTMARANSACLGLPIIW